MGDRESNSSLFRSESLDRLRSTSWQSPLLSTRVSTYALLLLTVASIAAIAVFGTSFQFTRKTQASGFLIPASGWTRIVASGGGVVAALHAIEGDLVHRGDILLEVASWTGVEQGVTVDQKILGELSAQREWVRSQLGIADSLFAVDTALHKSVRSSTERQLTLLNEQIAADQARLSNARRLKRIGQKMLDQGVIPRSDALALADEVEIRRASLAANSREVERLRSTLDASDARKTRLKLEHAASRARINAELRALAVDAARVESGAFGPVLSPRDGVVASVLVETGDSIRPGDPILDVLGADPELKARLFVRSADMGLVARGQEVRIYLDALPPESPSTVFGRVLSVSATSVDPNDFRFHATSRLPNNEPHYRVDVHFPSGLDLPPEQMTMLKPGMGISADIIKGHASLVDWILRPLARTTGRL